MLQDESILLAASTDKGVALLQSLVPPGSFPHTVVCRSGGECRRALLEQQFAMVLINTPLSDESGLDLALETAHSTVSAVLMLVKAELADAVCVRVEEHGVLVVTKPVVRQMFDMAMRYAMAGRSRLLALRAENDRLQRRLQEQRTVDRAKCLLIQYRHLSEDQAHRLLEKEAMDTRQTRIAVAQRVIAMYDE